MGSVRCGWYHDKSRFRRCSLYCDKNFYGMRGNILLIIVTVQCIFALLQPRIGLYSYIWFGLVRPDFIAFVPGRFNLSAILAIVTLFSAIRCFLRTSVTC